MAYTTINKPTDHFNTVTYSGSNWQFQVCYWSWISTRLGMDENKEVVQQIHMNFS